VRRQPVVLVAIAIALTGCAFVDGLLPPRPVISRDEAIAAAKRAEPDWADQQVLAAKLGTWADFAEPHGSIEGRRPDATDPVWVVNLGWQLGPLNGQGVTLVLDARDGHVIQRSHWIS